MTETITAMLDQLAKYQSQRDELAVWKQELINGILSLEQRTRISDIEQEFADNLKTSGVKIALLETEIKQTVLKLGESVRGDKLQAVWTHGRISWDSRSLDGYCKAHPELLEFRHAGEPSVSIRRVKSE